MSKAFSYRYFVLCFVALAIACSNSADSETALSSKSEK
jgi:hypothetical protein